MAPQSLKMQMWNPMTPTLKTLIFACSLHAAATSIVWFKANSKRLFEIDLSPFVWWLILGWALESLYLNAWWKLSENTNPWVAQITLASTGILMSTIWMSIFYGFHWKYLASTILVFSGAVISRL